MIARRTMAPVSEVSSTHHARYHRPWARLDRHRSRRVHHGTLGRPLCHAGVHRRRNRVLHATASARNPLLRAIRSEGSRDESAGHGSLPGSALARHRSRAARRSAQARVPRRCLTAFRVDGWENVALDDYALGDRRSGAGPAARILTTVVVVLRTALRHGLASIRVIAV